MEDTEMDIILSAVDNASDTFEAVQDAAENMGESVQEGAEEGSQGLNDMEESAEAAQDPLQGINDIINGLVAAEVFSEIADTLWDFADKAGTFEDSMMRASLEAEGAGISVDAMTDAVSRLSTTTGRAGSEIREAFITATARGITDIDSFTTMMEGAGAQATLLGTDIESMANKFSSLSMRSSVMERTLSQTGITVDELGQALGIQGATIDDVNAKWSELDTNQRAAALGMAASMNEGAEANEAYKNSWAGLQEQINIAKGRIERLAGEVLLPVLIPALEAAARVLDFFADQISAAMDGPFSGLISVLGAIVAGFALVVPAIVAVNMAMGFYTASLAPAIAATWALLAPWLPFIAIGAAIVAVVYEIGKAFGWWSDASSMMDALWAGIQRLWNAFINHPDVQAYLEIVRHNFEVLGEWIGKAVDWVKKFFQANNGGDFDIVAMWIHNIGVAWDIISAPIKAVIKVIRILITVFKQVYTTGKNNLQRLISFIRAFPGMVRGAISSLVNILTAPFRTAYNRITGIVGQIKSTVHNITGVNIDSVTNKITQPFTNAYNKIVGIVDKIKSKANSIGNIHLPSLGGMFGGYDLAYGGEDLIAPTNKSYTKDEMRITQDINLILDLRNVPNGVSEEVLYDALTSKEFINALVTNNDFQSLDAKVKGRINAKARRARGV